MNTIPHPKDIAGETARAKLAAYPPLSVVSIAAALQAVDREVQRQDEIARQGRFHGLHALLTGPDSARLPILLEEAGEVARELNKYAVHQAAMAQAGAVPRDMTEAHFARALKDELIQTAAVCVAWAAAIEEGR